MSDSRDPERTSCHGGQSSGRESMWGLGRADTASIILREGRFVASGNMRGFEISRGRAEKSNAYRHEGAARARVVVRGVRMSTRSLLTKHGLDAA